MQKPFTDDGPELRSSERNDTQSRLALLGGCSLAVAILAAALAGAEESERGAHSAQEGEPRPSATAPDSPDEPGSRELDSTTEPDSFDPDIEEILILGTESEGTRDFGDADSVTGFSAEDLSALGVQDIADLSSYTPNLEIVTTGATTPTFFIRGIGLNDFNANATGAVAIYQDDVVKNAPALQLTPVFDIEAVNVLRGPQGTGLARNATAGAIKTYSRKPTGDFDAYVRSDFGNYDFRDFEGAIEIPMLEDVLAGRFAFRFTQRDGTMQNRCGDAPPLASRAEVPTAIQLRNLGLKNTYIGGATLADGTPIQGWSICGEPVDRIGPRPFISDIPTGLESWVNNLDNWAARGTLLFQPTLDMSWLFNAHGTRRDELSRLGQSYGTSGFYCENGDVENCNYSGQPKMCVAPAANAGNSCSQSSDCDSAPGVGDGMCTSRIQGQLGGTQGTGGQGYQTREVTRRLQKLAPCFIGVPGSPNGTCDLPANLASANAAKITVAQELAEHLDSKPWEGDFDRTGPTKLDTWGLYLNGDVSLPFGMQLTSVTGYDTYDRYIDIDLDFSPEVLFEIVTDDDGWQVTQDLRLEGELGEESWIHWDIGGWFLREQLDVVVTNDFGRGTNLAIGQRDYTQDLWSAAGYASLSFDFWEDFTLDGGARYNWEQKKLDYMLITGALPEPVLENLNDTWHDPTGTVRLTYRFRDDTHAFWKYTRGWKPGTYNATSSLAQGVSVADPERIDAFETGMRGSWFDGRLDLDFAFFYYSYHDYQLFIAQQFSGGQPEFVILNADKAEVYGAEVEAVAKPWEGAYFDVRFGWLESQFLDFVQVQQEIVRLGGQQVTVNRELQNTGNPLLNSPRFKVSISAEQTVPIGGWGSLTARYFGVWTDTSYYDATEGRGIPNVENRIFLPKKTIAQPAFWLHNFRLSYQPPESHFEIAGWVRNITNKAYKTFAFDGSTFNNTTIYFVGDPRTYGLSFVVNY